MKRRLISRTLPVIHPNVGIRVAYRKAIEQLIAQMTDEVKSGVFGVLDGREKRLGLIPETAQDAARRSLAEMMQDMFDMFAMRWIKRFESMAKKMCPRFIKDIFSRVKATRKKALEKAGISIPFNSSLLTNEWIQAAIQYNVSLIKSIPSQYLGRVNEMVLRAMEKGFDRYDLKQELYELLTEELGMESKKAMNRAALIARDQSNKATQTLTMYTDMDMGITKGLWVHLPGRKMSRYTHIKMDGQEFDLREGLYDPDPQVRRKVKPGELILCACGYRSVIPQEWFE